MNRPDSTCLTHEGYRGAVSNPDSENDTDLIGHESICNGTIEMPGMLHHANSVAVHLIGLRPWKIDERSPNPLEIQLRLVEMEVAVVPSAPPNAHVRAAQRWKHLRAEFAHQLGLIIQNRTSQARCIDPDGRHHRSDVAHLARSTGRRS